MIPLRQAAALCVFATLLGEASAGDPVLNTKYAPFTIVLYNKNVEESRKLAAYYAEKRSIPFDNLIGFETPPGEIVSREDYETTIHKPLVALFDANGWWERETGADGILRPVTNKMEFAAIMYGMPLKISPSPGEPTGDTDPDTDKPVLAKRTKRNTDAASLDSELMLFGIGSPTGSGPGPNPYFQANNAFGRPDVLLTARLDGPSYAIAQRLIDDAIATEKTGLWGTAVIDIAKLTETMGPGYEIGDKWLENCALFYHKAGIPAVTDRSRAVLPKGYPLGGDIALYFGWYTGAVAGPFVDTEFRFKRGAVACHLHSYSASTLRGANTRCDRPLVHRGASAVLGNVYEPFLTMTTHFDLFNARLLGGFTLAESGWMASPAASWMTIIVGDPLYQPFQRGREYDMKTERDFKAYRLAVRKWGDKPEELMANLDRAAAGLKSARMHEIAGLHLLAEKNYALADAKFLEAKDGMAEPADKLRQELHRARALVGANKPSGAIKTLRAAAAEFKAEPGASAAIALANQLDPPPPPPPGPADK